MAVIEYNGWYGLHPAIERYSEGERSH